MQVTCQIKTLPEIYCKSKNPILQVSVMSIFFCQICFLVNIGLTVFNFPAKRLRKNTGAQNTHALFFFLIFFRYSCYKFLVLNFSTQITKESLGRFLFFYSVIINNKISFVCAQPILQVLLTNQYNK